MAVPLGDEVVLAASFSPEPMLAEIRIGRKIQSPNIYSKIGRRWVSRTQKTHIPRLGRSVTVYGAANDWK